MALKSKKHVQSPWGGFFFVLPSILAMAVFVYGMIGWTLKFSFSNRTSAWKKDNSFAGMARYTELLQDPEFTHAFSNLLKFTVVFMIGTMISGLIMALLLERELRAKDFSVPHIYIQWQSHLSQWELHGVGLWTLQKVQRQLA